MEHSTSHISRHMWIMMLCCLVPLAAMAAIFVFKVPVSQTLSYSLILLCPLGHIVMMAFMGGHGHKGPDRLADGATLSSGNDRAANTGPGCH